LPFFHSFPFFYSLSLTHFSSYLLLWSMDAFFIRLLCCVFMLRTHTASIQHTAHMKNRYEIVKFTCNHFVSISLFPLTTFSCFTFFPFARNGK
jgi:hypothetical protein